MSPENKPARGRFPVLSRLLVSVAVIEAAARHPLRALPEGMAGEAWQEEKLLARQTAQIFEGVDPFAGLREGIFLPMRSSQAWSA